MARGGAREGAGRKPKAQKYEGAISAAEQQIVDRLPRLIDNMMKLADGVFYEKEDGDGVVEIFSEPPNFKANEYLINRILGRPTERQEIEADISGEIEVTDIAKKEAQRKLDEWRQQQMESLRAVQSNSPPAPPT